MDCKININEEYFVVYECEEDKIAKIQKDIIECEVKGFEVINSKKKFLEFIAIDNCLVLSNEKIKRCDFALIEEKKVFLVELKTDVKPKNRTKKLKEAINQLKGCIFKKDYISKLGNIAECFVCFDKQVTVKSNWQRIINKFIEEEGILLKITCKKEF